MTPLSQIQIKKLEHVTCCYIGRIPVYYLSSINMWRDTSVQVSRELVHEITVNFGFMKCVVTCSNVLDEDLMTTNIAETHKKMII